MAQLPATTQWLTTQELRAPKHCPQAWEKPCSELMQFPVHGFWPPHRRAHFFSSAEKFASTLLVQIVLSAAVHEVANADSKVEGGVKPVQVLNAGVQYWSVQDLHFEPLGSMAQLPATTQWLTTQELKAPKHCPQAWEKPCSELMQFPVHGFWPPQRRAHFFSSA